MEKSRGRLDFRYGLIQMLRQYPQEYASLSLLHLLSSIIDFIFRQILSSPGSSSPTAYQISNQGRKKSHLTKCGSWSTYTITRSSGRNQGLMEKNVGHRQVLPASAGLTMSKIEPTYLRP